jgi:protein-S-isoprenylcysteine O-methyltransferase Ste14
MIVLIPFFVVWGLDSFIFQFSTFLVFFIPFAVRLVLAVVSFVFALLLLESSHKMILNKTQDSPRVLDTGVYGRIRHPMHFGTILVYVGFILATFSLLSFAVWVGIFFLYDKMASYEEDDLVRLLGDAYRNYQKNVPKWLPRITSPHK